MRPTARTLTTVLIGAAVVGGVGIVVERRAAAAQALEHARGEQMYRQGRLPSGAPMKAVVQKDLTVEGTMFTCVSCHLRSGFGTTEGKVVAPPVDADSLFHPAKRLYKGVEVAGAPPRRPAYTRESLASVLRTGVDPSGRVLDWAMPRYELEEEDAAILVGYLATLSPKRSEGVTDDEIRLATVITDEVPGVEQEIVLQVLEKYVAFKNTQAQSHEQGPDNRSARMASAMLSARDLAFKRLTLSRWILRGPPESWPAQLEALYQAGPPFALIAGITTGRWDPIHRFAEAKHLPTLMPVTDLPALSEPNDSTLYASKGFFQEGECVARYLASRGSPAFDGGVVELVRGNATGEALRAGFEETMRGLGLPPASAIVVGEGQPLPHPPIAAGGGPVAVLLWDGAAGLGELERILPPDATIFVSSTALGEGLWAVPESLRERTAIIWPRRLPADEERYAGTVAAWLGGSSSVPPASRRYRIAAGTFAATQILTLALMDLKGHYSRDYLLDVIGMLPDQRLPGFERLTFGVGQRSASNGCRIVRFDASDPTGVVKSSEWLTH